MKKSLSLWLIFCNLVLFACQTFSPTPRPTSEVIDDLSDCAEATEPTQEDIDLSLDFGAEIFDSSEWERSYTVEAQRVSVTWVNNEESAVAYLDYLIFSCGHSQAELEEYFGNEYWDIIFQNYQTYEFVTSCGGFDQELMLFEFDTVSSGGEYVAQYWAWPNQPDRVLTMFLVFPTTSKALMNSYAERMFPALMSCGE